MKNFSPQVLAKAERCTATRRDGELWTVDSPSGASYAVHTDGHTGVCDCQARVTECSHLAAVLLAIRGTTDTPRRTLAQRDQAAPADPFDIVETDQVGAEP